MLDIFLTTQFKKDYKKKKKQKTHPHFLKSSKYSEMEKPFQQDIETIFSQETTKE